MKRTLATFAPQPVLQTESPLWLLAPPSGHQLLSFLDPALLCLAWMPSPSCPRRPQSQQEPAFPAVVRQQLLFPASSPPHRRLLSSLPIGPLPPCSLSKPVRLLRFASPSTLSLLPNSPHPAPFRQHSTSSWLSLLRLLLQGSSPLPFSPKPHAAALLLPHTLARLGRPHAPKQQQCAPTLLPTPAAPGAPSAHRTPSTSVPVPSAPGVLA
mmetsp:Transcript_19293/g.51533  ORF Transcript_19293/g.51533 Transcript_19293/m.51533 type:complete len:211 (-) Transcript_19293:298-930(-)